MLPFEVCVCVRICSVGSSADKENNPLVLCLSVVRETVLESERGADRGIDIESARPAQTETGRGSGSKGGSEGATESTETGIDG